MDGFHAIVLVNFKRLRPYRHQRAVRPSSGSIVYTYEGSSRLTLNFLGFCWFLLEYTLAHTPSSSSSISYLISSLSYLISFLSFLSYHLEMFILTLSIASRMYPSETRKPVDDHTIYSNESYFRFGENIPDSWAVGLRWAFWVTRRQKTSMSIYRCLYAHSESVRHNVVHKCFPQEVRSVLDNIWLIPRKNVSC